MLSLELSRSMSIFILNIILPFFSFLKITFFLVYHLGLFCFTIIIYNLTVNNNINSDNNKVR